MLATSANEMYLLAVVCLISAVAALPGPDKSSRSLPEIPSPPELPDKKTLTYYLDKEGKPIYLSSPNPIPPSIQKESPSSSEIKKSKESKEFKEPEKFQKFKEPKEFKELKESKESKDFKEFKEPDKSKELKESKDSKDSTEFNESEKSEEPKQSKESQGSKEFTEPKKSKESKESNASEEPKSNDSDSGDDESSGPVIVQVQENKKPSSSFIWSWLPSFDSFYSWFIKSRPKFGARPYYVVKSDYLY